MRVVLKKKFSPDWFEYGEIFAFFSMFQIQNMKCGINSFQSGAQNFMEGLNLIFLNALNTYPTAWESPLSSSYETRKPNIKTCHTE